MKYTYPNGFDGNRAQELGALVAAAYNQLDQGAAWQIPPGYTLCASLSAKEYWKLLGFMTDVMQHLIQPVPFGFVATKGTDIYVVIRGTKTPLEWLDDFTAQPMAFQPNGQAWGNTTRGFKMLYDDLGPQIIAALTAIQTGGGRLQSIYVTGHSLGAALAHLAATGIAVQFGVKPVSYTFCGPRAGDPQFAKSVVAANLPTWRIFNTEDIVPTLPPAAIEMAAPKMGMLGLGGMSDALVKLVQLSQTGYQHVGYPIAATAHCDDIGDNHSLANLCQEIAS